MTEKIHRERDFCYRQKREEKSGEERKREREGHFDLFFTPLPRVRLLFRPPRAHTHIMILITTKEGHTKSITIIIVVIIIIIIIIIMCV